MPLPPRTGATYPRSMETKGIQDGTVPSVRQQKFPGAHPRRRGGLRRTLVVAAVSATVALSVCAAGGRQTAGGTASQGATPAASSVFPGPQVSLSCTPPANLPGQTVSVTLGDMGMGSSMMGGAAPMGQRMILRATPATVHTGQVSFVASNVGGYVHELVILPLAAGASAGKRIPGPNGKVDETGSLGEASASCAAGAGEGIASGSVGWVTVTLPPGRYELVCNVENHYADGMYQEFDVT